MRLVFRWKDMESAVNTSRNDCGFMVGLSLLGPRGKKQNGGPFLTLHGKEVLFLNRERKLVHKEINSDPLYNETV